jgi:dTDP-4-dehydrorhamnose reductase
MFPNGKRPTAWHAPRCRLLVKPRVWSDDDERQVLPGYFAPGRAGVSIEGCLCLPAHHHAKIRAPMHILITGGSGMLARCLQRHFSQHRITSYTREQLDIHEPGACKRALASDVDLVINCAAMTSVDLCEQQPELAYQINAEAPAQLATACQDKRIRLVHFSTDYVFSGNAAGPYDESHSPGPRTVYGASKLAGEIAVRQCCSNHLIVRTSWLYGPGGPSFVHKMIELSQLVGPALPVVDDQFGNPTSTTAVATTLEALLDTDYAGTVHVSCEGETTWYGLAREVISRVGSSRPVRPCTTAEFPRPARRPANSRLEKRVLHQLGLHKMPHWLDALTHFLEKHPHG